MSDRKDPPGAESEGPGPEDAGLSVDERFARMVAEIDGSAVSGKAAKEESARTRQLRAEWSVNPPKPVAWRADGPSTLTPSSKAGSARGESWGESYKSVQTKSRRRRRIGKPIALVVVVGLLGAGFYATGKDSHGTVPPLNMSPAGTAAPWADTGPSPSPSPSYADPDDAYFAGSPAIDWKNNEAGFVVPTAKALNGVSKSDVAAGYQLLYKVMAAGNLDATILDGGSTADYTKLLDPASGMAKQLTKDLAHPSYQNDPTDLLTRFNPKTTTLLGHTVKVSGSMSEAAGSHKDAVELTANYSFVYAVAPVSGDTSDHQRVVVHRTVEIEVVNPNAGYEVNPDKAWIDNYHDQFANDQCFQYDGYVNPQFTDNGALPNETGSLDPYATGNLLTQESAEPSPTSTGPGCIAGGTT
ncbi:hypothetical protein [Actinospica robiniae]|uniref:hypothetical protein n=1 Tax=Actinospica robiniae TaxID=304901 RepID=UPI0003F5888E|nr:hypothetical protein [Actinospica robiniae]